MAPLPKSPPFCPKTGSGEKLASPRSASLTPAAGAAGCGPPWGRAAPIVPPHPSAPAPLPCPAARDRGRRGVEGRAGVGGGKRGPGVPARFPASARPRRGRGPRRSEERAAPSAPVGTRSAGGERMNHAPRRRPPRRTLPRPPPARPTHRARWRRGGVPAPSETSGRPGPPPCRPPSGRQRWRPRCPRPRSCRRHAPTRCRDPPRPRGAPLSAPAGTGGSQPLPAIPTVRPGTGPARFGTARHEASEAGQAPTLLPPPRRDGNFPPGSPAVPGPAKRQPAAVLTGSAGGRGPRRGPPGRRRAGSRGARRLPKSLTFTPRREILFKTFAPPRERGEAAAAVRGGAWAAAPGSRTLSGPPGLRRRRRCRGRAVPHGLRGRRRRHDGRRVGATPRRGRHVPPPPNTSPARGPMA